jgi:predicted dehydrogenase
MKQKTLRAGIIGSGFAAKFHYDAMLRVYTAKVEIVGAYSRSSENLAAFTSVRKLKAFDSIESLIESSDVLHICTPPVTHEPLVLAALEQDKHVIVEKPFTGYFGDGTETFNGDSFSREKGLVHTLQSISRMLEA